MFSNIITPDTPSSGNEKTSLKSIYHKFQSLLGRGTELPSNRSNSATMLSARESTAASDDSYLTPVSSVGDLMTMSPSKATGLFEAADTTSDLLTGTELDSVCDITMREVPMFDDTAFDASSIDYLVKCASSTRNFSMNSGPKDSLFVKFDPLYARREFLKSPEVVPDSIEYDIGYETGSAASVAADNQTSTQHSLSMGPLTAGKEKPTQVVPPVVNDVKVNAGPPKPTPVLVRSVSAILTPTQVATDRLISFSGNTPPTAAPRSPRYNSSTSQVDRLQSLRIILQKQDQEVLQLTQENRELRSALREVENKYAGRVEELESKVRRLTDERDHLLGRENKLLQQLNDKIMSNKQMSIVMEEYEKTISSLIGEQQREKIHSKEIQEKLFSERDQALAHLTSMESSFNDLLAKYEKCKSIVVEAKEREKVFEQQITEYEAGMKKYDQLYNDLKQITADNLAKANETLESNRKNHNVEITKLNATIKKHEITISSLQESLTQKTRDNMELTRICDQLINEVR